MKKLFTHLFFLAFVVSQVSAQKISTDPDNAVNEERPELTNNFNWMEDIWSVYHPTPGGGYTDSGGGPINLQNPYYDQLDEYQEHFNLSSISISTPEEEFLDILDIQPKNGWELLHKHNGWMHDETTLITDPNDQRIGPYVILYNRYTGKLRVLASFDTDETADRAVTTMKFKSATGLEYSALLNYYGEYSQPLDQETDVIEVAEASDGVPISGTDFISADFQMSYDPCTCDHPSDLLFEFSTLNTANLTLEGRLIGIESPLDGSGNSPLLNREDFLMQVYKDDFEGVNGGALTYKNIEALVAKYKQPQLSALEKAAIDAFKAALKGGAEAIDKNFINKGAAVIFNSFAGTEPGQLGAIYRPESIGLGIMASGAKSLSAALFPTHAIPNIGFIEAEMVLSGTMTDENAIPNATARIAVPGSEESANVPWQFYPAYNKTLGLFAMLETPTVIVSDHEVSDATYYCQGQYVGTKTYKRYKLSGIPKYTFNPNSEVNVANTRVLGALVIDPTTTEGHFSDYIRSQFDSYRRNLSNVQNFSGTYMTPFFPLENLQDVIPEILAEGELFHDGGVGVGCNYPRYHADIDVKLRLIIEYEFHENAYGEVNRSIQVLTYPLNLSTGSAANDHFEDLETVPLSHSLYTVVDGVINSNFPDGINIWNEINISRMVSVDPGHLSSGGSYTMKAETINLTDGANIKPGITLTAGLPLPDRSTATPVSSGYVTSFCATNYRGNEYSGDGSTAARAASPEIYQEEDSVISQSDDIIIYPNPSSGAFTISFGEGATSCQEVKILSAKNELIYHKVIDDPSIGSIDIDLDLPPRDNYVKLYFEEGVVTRRIWIE